MKHRAPHQVRRCSKFAAGVVLAFGLSLLATGAWFSGHAAKAQDLLPLTLDTEAEREGDHPWKIDPSQSNLKIRVNLNGTLVEGAFSQWDAQINLDPENLDTAFVDARVDMTSLVLGDLSEQAKGVDFLNVNQEAEARFLSDFFWLRGDGRIDAEGLLMIGGVTKPFVLTFALGIEDQQARMQAYTIIDRTEFSVGTKSYATEESLAFAVEAAIDIVAEKQW